MRRFALVFNSKCATAKMTLFYLCFIWLCAHHKSGDLSVIEPNWTDARSTWLGRASRARANSRKTNVLSGFIIGQCVAVVGGRRSNVCLQNRWFQLTRNHHRERTVDSAGHTRRNGCGWLIPTNLQSDTTQSVGPKYHQFRRTRLVTWLPEMIWTTKLGTIAFICAAIICFQRLRYKFPGSCHAYYYCTDRRWTFARVDQCALW